MCILSVYRKQNFLRNFIEINKLFNFKRRIIYSVKMQDDFGDLEEPAELPSKVRQVRFEQDFQYDTKDFFEPITKIVNEALKVYWKDLKP